MILIFSPQKVACDFDLNDIFRFSQKISNKIQWFVSDFPLLIKKTFSMIRAKLSDYNLRLNATEKKLNNLTLLNHFIDISALFHPPPPHISNFSLS